MDNDMELTLLTLSDLSNDPFYRQYDYYQYGIHSSPSDLAALLGVEKDTYPIVHIQDENDPKNNQVRTSDATYYLKTTDGKDNPLIAMHNGNIRGETRSSDYPGIRPVLLPHNDFELITKNKKKGYLGISEVEYGEYPQYVAPENIQKALGAKHFMKQLPETGRYYTLKSVGPHGFKKYPEYEYDGKKYICFAVNNVPATLATLSNGKRYKMGSLVWIEVSPIDWIVVEDKQMLVSKDCLAAGVKFDSPNIRYTGDFKSTEMSRYLNQHMLREMFQGMPKKEQVVSKSNGKSDDVNRIVNEIQEIIKPMPNSDNIMQAVNNLVNGYNKNLEEAFKNKGRLSLDYQNEETLYLKLMADLKEILEKAKANYEKYKEYYSMLRLNNEYLKILDSDKEEKKQNISKFESFLVDLKKIVLLFQDDDKLFLNDDKMMSNLKNIFLEEEKNIKDYLNGNNNFYREIKSVNDFELHIRKKLQPFLINLNEVVRNEDLANKLRNEYAKFFDGKYNSNRDDYVTRLLKSMGKIVNEINKKGNKEEKERLAAIVKDDISNSNDLFKLLDEMKKRYMDVYGIAIDMQARIDKEQRYQDYSVTLGNSKSNK